MTKTLMRILLAALLMGGVSLGSVAVADVNCVRGDEGDNECNNVQEGDNNSETNQRGSSTSGDAVAGQVTGVVSAGDASVDATNRSEDVDIETGDASGTNSATTYTGLLHAEDAEIGAEPADVTIEDSDVENALEGDNDSELNQTANASTGDGVGGQVIGVVTAAGGSADVVAANRTEDADIETGDADSNNDAAAFVGLASVDEFEIDESAEVSDVSIEDSFVDNAQEGDNDFEGDQTARASTGDGVAGQVLGVVSAGDASVDATNRSEDVDVETGDADANNSGTAFVGLLHAEDAEVGAEPSDVTIEDSDVENALEGDNDGTLDQTATASSGDSVAGQVAGVVTSAGGSADLVLANTSVDSDGTTGDTEFSNDDALFVGLSDNEFFDLRL